MATERRSSQKTSHDKKLPIVLQWGHVCASLIGQSGIITPSQLQLSKLPQIFPAVSLTCKLALHIKYLVLYLDVMAPDDSIRIPTSRL